MHLVSGCVSAVSVAPMRDETNEAAGAARASFLRGVTPLVRTHRARLLALARGQGLAAEDALDCVQDALSAFLQSAEALGLARCPEEAGRVLCARVVHAAQNQRRWLARRAPAADDTDALALAGDAPGPDDLVERAEARSQLLQCVERLTRMQQAVVRLRLLEEHPGEEVSELLGVSAQNVRVLLFRARQRLRECLVLAGDVDGAPS